MPPKTKKTSRTPASAVRVGDPPRNLKLDKRRIMIYLNHLARTGRIIESATMAGVSHGAIKNRRRSKPEFKLLEEEAKNIFVESMEERAHEMAFIGIEEPVFQGGELVGHKTRLSEKLVEFLLKAHAPEKYRDNKIEIEHGGGVLIVPARLDPKEWAEKEDARMRKAQLKYGTNSD